MGKLSFNEFLQKIIDRTFEFYRDEFDSNPKKRKTFENNLEDLLLFKMVTLHGTRVMGTGKYDRNGSVGNCIMTALESVDIQRSNINGLYADICIEADRLIMNEVKRKIITNEIRYFGESIFDFTINKLSGDKSKISNVDFLDFCFALADRKSGYNEERNVYNNEFLIAIQRDIWKEKKITMDSNSFTYKVLKNIIEDDPLYHYSRVERDALKKMCFIMDRVENKNFSSFTSVELYKVSKSINVAKMYDKDKIEPFSYMYFEALSKGLVSEKIKNCQRLRLVK